MHGEVLGASEELAVFADAEVFAVIAYALQTADHGEAHLGSEVGVFAISLLAAPPAGITEDVDVGRPVG